MKITRLGARAFGPFVDRELEFTPGMNVIVAPNEAGKSSLHAALLAGICGIRRARGSPRAEERDFEAQYRPWDNDRDWRVEVRLTLANGRRIELAQDLAGRVNSRAVDLDLGTDLPEIVDGTPDASRLLGLDRRAFAATACVRQADLLSILGSASELQDHLQRAAATRGTDATAAQAIERLMEFQALHVGSERAPKRPLMLARSRVAEAEQAVTAALQAHADFLELERRLHEAQVRVHERDHEFRLFNAATARREATIAARRAARASELAARHPSSPPGLTGSEDLAAEVSSALGAWRNRPSRPEHNQRNSSVIAGELAALPEAPQGDLSPDRGVVDAKAELDRAREALALMPEPPIVPARPATELSEADLRRVAEQLAAVPDRVAAGASYQRTHRRWLLAGMVLGACLVAAGTGGVIAGLPAMVIVAIIGVAVFGWSLMRGWRGLPEAHPDTNHMAAQAGDLAMQKARRAGLPADSIALLRLADAIRAVDDAHGTLDAWQRNDQERRARVAEAEDQLQGLIEAHGELLSDGADEAFALYLARCAARASQASVSGQASGLKRELEAQQALERQAQTAEAARAEVREALSRAAAAVGLAPSDDDEELVLSLQRWQAERSGALVRHETSVREWQELDGLLEGRSLQQLADEAQARAVEADDLARGIPDGELSDIVSGAEPSARLEELRRNVQDARNTAQQLEGQVRLTEATLPDAAASEEESARAKAAHERTLELGQILGRTIELVSAAQERVHRDLAPVLAGALRPWLPRVTAGRYEDVIVNPSTLAVKVRPTGGGPWRDAHLLSQGTREQIYLLLRVAIAEHLVRPGEVAPLLLDEVTVQSDDERVTKVLDLLHELSADRQVILFTHDSRVVAWASSALQTPQDLIRNLSAEDAA